MTVYQFRETFQENNQEDAVEDKKDGSPTAKRAVIRAKSVLKMANLPLPDFELRFLLLFLNIFLLMEQAGIEA